MEFLYCDLCERDGHLMSACPKLNEPAVAIPSANYVADPSKSVALMNSYQTFALQVETLYRGQPPRSVRQFLNSLARELFDVLDPQIKGRLEKLLTPEPEVDEEASEGAFTGLLTKLTALQVRNTYEDLVRGVSSSYAGNTPQRLKDILEVKGKELERIFPSSEE